MQSSSLFPLMLLVLGTLVPWTVEGVGNAWKAGLCPSVPPDRCLSGFEKFECRSDWQCPGRQICCSHACGIKCLDPVNVSNSIRMKPGRCPVVYGQCLMLNPPNHCETDRQCVSNLKCCKGMCGKACVDPE
ncbi:antileukoproteinase-like [Lycaon pictus]|uniref:Protease inhibitor n=4 Tax=Canis lupus TaxID=9612 RepID=A8QWU1_CANLF|nr:antileukoproteinase precursor [Canis lupus familiaris]XP_025324827.1 antileukoproteinase-like [Canis lupus dingo]BAF91495.1 protease inhibitor [Canis lupus familiaris]|eukprot:NP_001106642.1 antileukoproteinase precursor [Canis lupus familiaris]